MSNSSKSGQYSPRISSISREANLHLHKSSEINFLHNENAVNGQLTRDDENRFLTSIVSSNLLKQTRVPYLLDILAVFRKHQYSDAQGN